MKKLNIKAFVMVAASVALAVGFAVRGASATVPGVNELLNVDSGGDQGNSDSGDPYVSGNGQYAAFDSTSSNLVTGDTDGFSDVFVRDIVNGTTTRVSVTSSGAQADGASEVEQGAQGISYNGQRILFDSSADNLVDGVDGHDGYLFVHDMNSGENIPVNTTAAGSPGNDVASYAAISGDGRFVVFESYATNLVSGVSGDHLNIFEKDLDTGAIKLLSAASDGSEGNEGSYYPSISCDGGIVAFMSSATNVVDGVGAHGGIIVDALAGDGNDFSLVTPSPNAGLEGPVVSCNGNDIAYSSYASNLVSGDTNSTDDVFEYNRLTGETTRVSVATDGTQGDDTSYSPSISDDGRYVAFQSYATTLSSESVERSGPNIYVHDLKDGTTQLISKDRNGDKCGASQYPSISPDGSQVAYLSSCQTLLSSGTITATDAYISETGF